MAGELTNWTPGTPNTTYPTKVNSYKGLLHFVDNAGQTASLQAIADGLGNSTGIKISDTQISIEKAFILSSLAASKLVYLNASNILTTIADGTVGQALVTDGAGGYSFATVAGGGGITINSTAITSGTAGRILFENASNQVSEAAGLTYSSGLFTVLGTTQQAKFAYDASNHLGITIDSSGNATFGLTGTTPKFTFSQGAIIETISAGLGKAAVSTNTTFGVDSLNFANTTGSNNAAFGYHALKANTTGINNSAFGSLALEANVGGSYNTSIGHNSMQVMYSGDNNVAIGYNAGKEHSSFGNNINCNASVLIGYKTKVNASGQSNQIVIGSDAIGLGSNTVVLGNTSIVNTYLRGDVAIGLNTAASARLHLIKTTEQLRVGYNTTNYASFTTGATGNLAIALTGTNPRTTFSQGVTMGGTLRLTPYTVATLPSGVVGDTAYVTDATAPTYLGALTGGGAVTCPVFYNGAAWVSA